MKIARKTRIITRPRICYAIAVLFIMAIPVEVASKAPGWIVAVTIASIFLASIVGAALEPPEPLEADK